MAQHNFLSIIILGAGKGTRMKSNQAKVLHEIFYAPMIHHVIKAVKPLNALQKVVIVGHQREKVLQALAGFNVEFVVQEQQLGTGHAVLCAENNIDDRCETVMILCGDTPLVRSESLAAMVQHHNETNAALTVMTTILEDSTNYGRIICDASGKIRAIVEEKDATDAQKNIKEINAGIYCVQKSLLFNALKRIDTNNSQGEAYLTDILSLAVDDSFHVEKFINSKKEDILGVNSRIEMARAHKELQLRRNRELMTQGISMMDPDSISIDNLASINNDTIIHSGVHISGNTEIGTGCILENGVILNNCLIGKDSQIGAYSYLDSLTIKEGTILGPYTTNKKTDLP